MVRMKNKEPGVRTMYYYKTGQNPSNTKFSERSLALIIPQVVFDRFSDNVPESEKVALLAEREAKKIATLKQAAYNMKKTWEDTTQNLARKRRKEILSRRKFEEAERIKFMEEMKAKNALERAEIVKQAKELILNQKPQCRLINRSLLVSECLRELEEQIKFKDSIKCIYKKLDDEHARAVIEDVKKFKEEEEEKHKAQMLKMRKHREELEKQIKLNETNLKIMNNKLKMSEMEDLQNMTRDIREIKEKELNEARKKKENLKKMFLEAIEEKRQNDLKMQQEDEFQNKSLEIYKNLKQQMDKIAKEKAKKIREERAALVEKLALKIREQLETKKRAPQKNEEAKKEKEAKQIEEQHTIEELERMKKEKQKKIDARLEMQQQYKILEEEEEKRKKKENDLKMWETMQRYKRDEFNKKWKSQHEEKEKQDRKMYGEILKIQMAEKDAERKQIRAEEDDSVVIKEMLDKVNEKVLTYGEKVLEESKGVRPIYPIAKTIHLFKKEIGLIPRFNKEINIESECEIPKRKRGRRTVCTKPTKEGDILLFG